MERTTVTLSRELVDELMKVVRAKNKTRAVIMALEKEIRRKKIERIRGMAGKIEFVKESEEIRHGNHRTG
ncbi:MAG TPA: DUF2191 domain-containing protein [Candidatus Omnitrophica bacterium]|nr:DUF2191 domain-containing protein [Candidatus Omnitrophota bacterium]